MIRIRNSKRKEMILSKDYSISESDIYIPVFIRNSFKGMKIILCV